MPNPFAERWDRDEFLRYFAGAVFFSEHMGVSSHCDQVRVLLFISVLAGVPDGGAGLAWSVPLHLQRHCVRDRRCGRFLLPLEHC